MNNEYFELHPSNELRTSDLFPRELDPKNLSPTAELLANDPYAFMFPYGDVKAKPFMYFHHGWRDHVRFNGVTDLGDDWLSHQHPGRFHDIMAQPGCTVTKKYERFDDGRTGYVIQVDEPFSQLIHYDDGSMRCREADVVDLLFKPLKYGNVDYGNMWKDNFQLLQPCLVSGFFDGTPVIGMGSYDRTYVTPEELAEHDIWADSKYIYMVGHGVRQDGRMESYMLIIGLYGDKSNGINNAYYWIDGEEPIVVNDARIEAEWVHLPYVDDGTVVYKDAVIHIGDKVIHFNGKWGTKGYTKFPKIERHGQSQIHGTWYEGDEPYDHKMYYAWGEHNGAFDKVIEAYGLTVVD